MRFSAFLPIFLLIGCTQTPSSYPSLLPRPIESTGLAEPEVTQTPVAADSALDTRIAELRAQLATSAGALAAAAQNAEARIAGARGAAEGSEAWLGAQAALGELSAPRTSTAGALAELERLAIDRGARGEAPYPALDAAVAAAAEQNAREAARVAALEAAIASR